MKFIDKLLYGLLYSWMYVHALLPFKVLYALSDFLYILIYYVIRYRKKVARNNLRNSFPEKPESELIEIEKKFYRHFCDYFVETIKLLHISDKEMQKRIVFENPEVLQTEIEKGRSGFLFLGHYGNWEWVPSLTLCFRKELTLGQIYKPLKNKAFDHIFLKIRSRFGSVGIPKNDTYREIVRWKHQGRQSLIGFMADQTPTYNNIHYWTDFLNQDTPVFTGVERIARKVGGYIAYMDIRKVKRGYYRCRFEMLSTNPETEEEMSITENYIRMIEKTILREPAYWLWTHKRWKYKREDKNKT
jgi:KDO2-lipid IV(A) lauroyltransferase